MEVPKGKHHLDDMGIDMRIILKWFFLDGGGVTICQ
jgi:hypothetical protein